MAMSACEYSRESEGGVAPCRPRTTRARLSASAQRNRTPSWSSVSHTAACGAEAESVAREVGGGAFLRDAAAGAAGFAASTRVQAAANAGSNDRGFIVHNNAFER